MKTTEPIYLNIGGPATPVKGFVRIGPTPDADIVVDAGGGLPFASESTRGIYCENYLERLDRSQILVFLRECRRILAFGGTLRIATSDLDAIVDAYARNSWQRSDQDNAGHQWYTTRAGFLNSRYGDEGCKWLVDHEELLRLGGQAGFASPTVCRADESRDPLLGTVAPANDSTLIVEFTKREENIPDSPLVSVVIPAYKPRFFRDSLLSATGQTYRNIEILVLDDSPSDFIEDITLEIATHDPRVKYIRNTPPLGEIENLSKGIVRAAGEFIKPLYDDDILFPEAIEKLLSLFREVPDAGLAAGRRTYIDTNSKVLEEQPPVSPLYETSGRISGTKAIAQIAEAGMNLIGEPTVILFRKRDALAINEPNVMSLFGEECMGIGDLALFAHLLSMGDLAYTRDTVSQFRIHSEQTQRREDVVKRIPLVWEFFRECIIRLGFRRQPDVLLAAHLPRIKPLGKPNADTEAPDGVGPCRTKDIYDREAYSAWLHRRVPSPHDREALAKIASTRFAAVFFRIIVRLGDEHRSRLADTLDSLNYQLFANWHVQVVTQMAAPAGIEEAECIEWHTVAASVEKTFIDTLVQASPHLWAIELPAGVVLDPLCLWRLAHEITTVPDAVAFFVDDDIYDRNGARKKPRFKPGTNPAWLLSSDLAGPLFVRGDVWHDTGGAAVTPMSPWFEQLLRISDRHGWKNIHHVADVLASYPGQFPSDIESCLTSLIGSFFRKGIAAELEPASKQSWRIRYPLDRPPRVSIVVISRGQFDLLVRCINSILDKTGYLDYEIILVVPETTGDQELETWLTECSEVTSGAIRTVRHSVDATFGKQCNLAAAECSGELMAVVGEGCVAIDSRWLDELVRPTTQPTVAGVVPRLLVAGTATLDQAGAVFGLDGLVGYPYREAAELSEPGYLDWLHVARDIGLLGEACFLTKISDYRTLGGMDEAMTTSLATADLSLRMTAGNLRLLYQPTAVMVGYRHQQVDIADGAEQLALCQADKARAEKVFVSRWMGKGKTDPFWNIHLSLAETSPKIEADYFAQWHVQPTAAPRIMARQVTNPQGDFRITSYLRALRNAGKASECIWPQFGKREPTAAEIQRMAPDSLVIQHYILDHQLNALRAWHESPARPFIIFAMDDLLTNMDATNPFRKGHPANNRSRLKFALERCDRLVVSTDFLADCFSHLARDVRVVPNRLEMAIWLPLRSSRRTSARPRIGWAGGTTHMGDLGLLKEVIERTRNEADWIFFGMCPPEVRPSLAEYHELVSFSEYPARLASLNFDIAVAPLAETSFNRAKSNLRLLEYGMLGIPVVCTDIDPYRNSPACRVENTADAWVRALRERIHDADAREREGQEMRRWVRQGYLLENHLDEWLIAHLKD